MEQQELYIKSSLDGSMQPSLFYEAAGEENRPLLVGLHTWSNDRFNQIGNMLPYAEKYNFHLLLPEFRGANLVGNEHCAQACASPLAKQDIKDAVLHVCENARVDTDNIFLLGLSGGGHMAMMMAGFCPELFKTVAAFAPISDLKRWAEENPAYTKHILACCENSDLELKARSPMSYIDEIAKSHLKIFHGKQDTVVSVFQTLDFYEKMRKKHPEAEVYLDIFQGGHEIDMDVAFHWLLSHYAEKQLTEITG